jgi:hypothetical protein
MISITVLQRRSIFFGSSNIILTKLISTKTKKQTKKQARRLIKTINFTKKIIMAPNANVPPAPVEIDEENPSTTSKEEDLVVKDLDTTTDTMKADNETSEEVRTNKFVIIVAAAAALGGMIFGYDIGGAGTFNLKFYFTSFFVFSSLNLLTHLHLPSLCLYKFLLPVFIGATFLMEGFRVYFGWDCPENSTDCVPASESEINTDQGLINGLFGAGAAM